MRRIEIPRIINNQVPYYLCDRMDSVSVYVLTNAWSERAEAWRLDTLQLSGIIVGKLRNEKNKY